MKNEKYNDLLALVLKKVTNKLVNQEIKKIEFKYKY